MGCDEVGGGDVGGGGWRGVWLWVLKGMGLMVGGFGMVSGRGKFRGEGVGVMVLGGGRERE